MTKYILHGGNTSRENVLNQEFFNEISLSLNAGDKLLMCYFAPSDNGDLAEEEKFERGKSIFKKYNPDSDVELILALRENFIEQLKEADALYIHGGGTNLLFETLEKYPNFIEELKKKKLVVGTSAGAYILAKYSIDYDDGNKAIERFGVLPIKIFCHFKEKARNQLEKQFKKVDLNNKLETVFLKDCEMKVIKF